MTARGHLNTDACLLPPLLFNLLPDTLELELDAARGAERAVVDPAQMLGHLREAVGAGRRDQPEEHEREQLQDHCARAAAERPK